MTYVRQHLVRYAPILILMLLWEAISRSGLVDPEVLPNFHAIGAAWWGLLENGDLGTNAWHSLVRLLAGLAAATVVGIPLGILMATSAGVRIAIGPLVRMLFPLPKAALIPITLIWLGLGDASKIVLIFLGCLLPVLLSAFNGARGVDKVLVWSARSIGSTRLQVLWEVALPAAMPEILVGFRSALSLSFALLVAAELTIANNGLGYLVGDLGENSVYAAMFAVIFTIAFVGFLVDRLWLKLMARMLVWRA